MLLENERKKIIEYSLRAIDERLTNGTSGNISIYNRDLNLVAISPTGISYNKLKPEMISIVDMDGNLIEGLKPSSEIEMHLIMYKNRDDINSVVHTHPVYTTVLACLREKLPAIDYMVAVTGDKEVRCAEYASYGTKRLAENAYEMMGMSNAVILANHGLTTVGKDLANAYNITVQVEYVSSLYIKAKAIGNPMVVEDEEMDKILLRFKSYGQVVE